ncbi:tripartite tricarboxylate transporter substrate binding protein [Oceanobacillus picturae]|uniref:tripartite tricarboxylate transporter substrate binding protein n=1 Tax=Oceanobacillus picturae TaxID=171693 RepID=UPI000E67BC41|nr:tripartite tricarboxylate transporter substrate-binding protein [Oceanobacillus picturae]RIU91174.1 tripartite tricarboxylate transporter substrate binding protein [Oceanobacillus picturae]
MKKVFIGIVFVILLIFSAACSASDEEASGTEGSKEWNPEKPIEIVAPAGAGGGWDTTARMAAKVFTEEEIIDSDIGVVNKAGGGGAVGWAYVAGQEGSPYNMFVASPPLLFIPLNGQSEYGHEDFTPIANVIADYAAFAVAADAKWDNLNELFDDMKKDPSSITVVGTSSPGSMDHIQFVQIAKAAGVDVTKIKYVSDQDGVGLTQLLNGSVDVFSTGVSETVEQVKAGTIKVLGVTSEERLEGDVLEDFPTAKEQGIDATFVNWRGFFGPPNMDEEAVAYYEEKFKELSDSEAFADIRKQFGWDEMYMNSEEYKQFLDEKKGEIQSLLDELGLGE